MESNHIEEQDQNHHVEDTSRIPDLTLSCKESNHGLKPELNTTDAFNMISSNADRNRGVEPRVFSCKYCMSKFYSYHALGGHQNAHKRERRIEIRRYRLGDAVSSSAGAFAVVPLRPLPLDGPLNRSLGIQVHSMVHNPSGSGTFGWTRKPFDHQLAGKPLGSSESGGGGGGRFGSVHLKTCQDEVKKLDLSLKL